MIYHDDVIKWKPFPRYWPFVRGFHRSPVNTPHKGQWRGALMLSLIFAWTNGWVNNRDAGDLRRHRANYDITVMFLPEKSDLSTLRIKYSVVRNHTCWHSSTLCFHNENLRFWNDRSTQTFNFYYQDIITYWFSTRYFFNIVTTQIFSISWFLLFCYLTRLLVNPRSTNTKR